MERDWNGLQQTLEGHSKSVESLAFSYDSRMLASGSSDQSILLWDPTTGILKKTLTGHIRGVITVAFSPDGKWLASGSIDRTIRLWDVNTGQLCQVLPRHIDRTELEVELVLFSPNSQQLALGFSNGMTRLCNIGLCDSNTRVSFKDLKGQRDCICSIAFSPNGKWLASGSEDTTIQLWDTNVGVLSTVFKGHIRPVKSVVFSPNSQQLISVDDGAMVLFWDTATGVLQKTLEVPIIVRDKLFTLSLDGQWLASADSGGTVQLRDTNSGTLYKTFQGLGNTANAVAFSPDSLRLALGYDDNIVRLWEMDSNVPFPILKGDTDTVSSIASSPDYHNLDTVSSIAFSPDNQHLASGSLDGKVRIWDVDTGALCQTLAGHCVGMDNSIVFSPDSRWLAFVYRNGTMHLWDTRSRTPYQARKGYIYQAWSMSFSFNGQRLALGSPDGIVRLLDAKTGSLQDTLKNEVKKSVAARDFLPDSRWKTSNPIELRTRSVTAIVFSLDSRQLALGYDNGMLLLMDSSIGTLHRVFEAISIQSVAFSPDSRYLASGSIKGTISLWDIYTGVLYKTLDGYTGSIRSTRSIRNTRSILSITFSLDGRWLASGSRDNTIQLWNMNTGTLHKSLNGHSSSVNSVVFSPNGQKLASVDTYGIVRLWNLGTGTTQQAWAATSTSRLSFMDDSKIVVDRGVIDLSYFSDQPDEPGIFEQVSTTERPEVPSWVGLGFSNDNSWITWDGQNILWLPSAYRPVVSAITQQKVAIGCGSGRVLLIGFSDSHWHA